MDYIIKLCISSSCDNCVNYYRPVGCCTLHCVVIEKCTASLVDNQSSAVNRLASKMSGYEGIISNFLNICWFLISLPLCNTEMILNTQSIYRVGELYNF